MMATLEFYDTEKNALLAKINDSAVPRKDEYINIKNITWKVHHVSWAIDTDPHIFRANIELVPDDRAAQ
jgi:hypothetical protein